MEEFYEEREPRRLDATRTAELLHTTVARDLGIAIVQGKHAAGALLPGELTAVRSLGISRPAYREAIRMLAAKNLVEIRPKSGTRVLPRHQWNLLDPDVLGWILQNGPADTFLTALFDVRMIVEPAVAALAAQRRTQSHLERMAGALDAMRRHRHGSAEAQAADALFHKVLLDAADNEILSQLASLIGASVSYLAGVRRSRHAPRDPRPDCEALFRAISARSSEAARSIVSTQIDHAREDGGDLLDDLVRVRRVEGVTMRGPSPSRSL